MACRPWLRPLAKASSVLKRCQNMNTIWARPFSTDFNFEDVFTNNQKWANTKRATDPDFFKNLAKGQEPKILWIGCADARVPANEIIGLQSGEVFVQRNVANLVLSIDNNVQAVIQYAVDVLKVPHIIVCGHYDCGGIRAATQNMNHGSPLENWLRNIRDVYRLHMDELEQIPAGEARVRRLVELNLVEQCLNVYKTASVQKSRWKTYQETGKATPVIHGLVYDLANGELHRVEADMKMKIEELEEMYDLYDFKSRYKK